MTLRGFTEGQWYDQDPSAGARIAALPLRLLSFFYGLGVRGVGAARGKGILRTESLPGYVVSVGNLTVGGTGKTPAAALISLWAKDRGHRVAVLSRGYGGKNRERALIVSDGVKVLAGPEKAGDEPLVLAQNLEGIPVLVGRKRLDAGLKARDVFGSDFFVLDDGFQHQRLSRDLDLLLLDAAFPWGNGRLLPAGPLREPLEAVHRADALILTRADAAADAPGLASNLARRWKPRPVFQARHAAGALLLPGAQKAPPGALKGRRVVAFAGIARPGSFRRTLEACGAEVLFLQEFGDHHDFRPRELREVLDRARERGADTVLTTEKDWIRLYRFPWAREHIGYLSIQLEMLNETQGFFDWLERIVPPPAGKRK